jgi:uncharacterized secreted protein with C-terminal beta-propeller domain
MKYITVYSFCLIFLTACASNSNSSSNEARSAGSLVLADENSLSTYFKEAFDQSSDGNPNDEAPTEVATSESASADGAGGSSVSGTNLQESGVDEADLIKTDGRYIYSIDKSEQANTAGPADEVIVENPSSNSIRIMDSQGTGLTQVKRIKNPAPDSQLSGLYLTEDKTRLVATASQSGNYYGSWFYPGYFANQRTDLLFVDVQNPASAAVKTELHIDGALISSRRTGNTLYLAMRHYPSGYPDPAASAENQDSAPPPATNFLPTYSLNQGPKHPLVLPSECYLQPNAKHSASIITLVAVDLSTDIPALNSRCFVGSAEALYASTEALYLATTRYDYQVAGDNAVYSPNITTDIHKFAFDALNLEYRGSAEVRGHLGWHQDRKSFRFSEKDGFLRLLTFAEDQWNTAAGEDEGPVQDGSTGTSESPIAPPDDGSNGGPPSTAKKSPVLLTILKEDPNKAALQQVAQLPNKNHPEPIGLPGEKLYASRFIGDRAFLVTFRVTDPLYILDLSKPTDPFVAGSLKVDGYSDYLHPISDTLLLGIGKDAIPDERQGETGDGRGAWYQGVKLSLLDISDPSQPRETSKIVLGKRGTEAAVLRNHHGLTGLLSGDTYRIALPVSLHEREGSPNASIRPESYYNYSQAGLYRFDISVVNQTITEIPPLVVSDYNQHPTGQNVDNDRSVIMGDNVHYLHWGQFWSQDWAAQGTITGPR